MDVYRTQMTTLGHTFAINLPFAVKSEYVDDGDDSTVRKRSREEAVRVYWKVHLSKLRWYRVQ